MNFRLLLFFALVTFLNGREFFEEAPIYYSQSQSETAVDQLATQIEARKALNPELSERELLKEILAYLKVPIESQILVFSKTSAQNSYISPWKPRAIYFSDNAYVGWVQGGDIETITFDKNLGMVFHLIDLNKQTKGAYPEVKRRNSCLSCHANFNENQTPGLLVRSITPDSSGHPLLSQNSYHTGHQSPIKERWGGWYVTGSSGGEPHMGNRIFPRENIPDDSTPPEGDDLSNRFNANPYLAGKQSDIVALMILEHQVTVHNALLKGHLATRHLLHQQMAIRKALRESTDAPLSGAYQEAMENHAEDIVAALFFKNEYLLSEDGPEGSRSFQKAFQANSRKASHRYSLKDLRLYERLFKFRCSYLIYSEAFEFLVPEIKSLVLRKMKAILENPQAYPDYNYFSKSEAKRIQMILTETLPAWTEID